MRSTARVLSVAALASAMAGFAASAALADPGAEVSPTTGSPGGSVTVSVSCESTGGKAPDTIDATSQAFEEGTVQLRHVPGNDEATAGAAYRGTARIASAADIEGAGPDAVGPDGADGAGPDAVGPDTVPPEYGPEGDGSDAVDPESVPDPVGGGSAWTVDGHCPAPPGGKGKPWKATFHVGRGAGGGSSGRPCGQAHGDDCGGGAVQHGVEAGAGGAFTDSVPALAAGGVLIAAALGGAAYRLWLRRSPGGGRPTV
jgi:hypothetical protein